MLNVPPLLKFYDTGKYHKHKYTMIDFVKLYIPIKYKDSLLKNELLDFRTPTNIHTGECGASKNKKIRSLCETAEYKGMKFKINECSIFISGSLHKYMNNGEHNYNDFRYTDFIEVLQDIENKFCINPYDMCINQIEIGINIQPPYKTKDILKHCFMHRKKEFKNNAVPQHGNYKQAEHTQYIIKIYDKAKQYRNKGIYTGTNEILRFEIKYRKTEKLQTDCGLIKTIYDVINTDFSIFTNLLVKEWTQVLFYDYTINSDSKRILNYKNPLYWQELKTKYHKHKTILQELIKNHSENIPQQIANCIQKKGEFLNNRGVIFDRKCNTEKNHRGVIFDTLYILSIRTPHPEPNKHICRITGIDISMQRKNSFLLSISGLNYYYENDKKTFELIKQKFLTNYWSNTDFKTQIHEIYHNIRNRYNNLKIKQKRLYSDNQMQLFT